MSDTATKRHTRSCDYLVRHRACTCPTPTEQAEPDPGTPSEVDEHDPSTA